MAGWVYGGSSATTPGGADQDIQFNNNGEFSGSSLLTTDGSGSLSASANISASAFYGDGSNLTNVTASAVEVADGPQYSLQFRFDSPVSGDLSGSSDLLWDPATSDVLISGNVRLEDGKEFYGDLEGAILFVAKVDEVGGIGKGKAVYIKGLSGTTPTIGLAACDDPAKMPAFGLCAISASNNANTQVATFGSLDGLNLNNISPGHSFSEGDILYVNTGSGGTAGTFTNVKPTGSSNLVQNIGKVVRNGASSNAQIKVGGAGRANDTPNLDKGHIFIGNDTDQTIQDNTIFISASANRVGINNTNPDHTLTVSGDISASVNISASAFYGNGAGITGISLVNLDAAGSDTNIQFNQNGEFAANAGFAYDGTGSITVSGNLGSIDYLKDWGGGPMATTESLGGKITLGGYGNPYLQTRNINVPDIGGGYNNFDIGHSGQIHLSSSMGGGAFEFEGIKFTNNPGDGIVGFESNRISFYHNTGSLTGDALEYVWAINSDHAGSGEESAWVKLDLSSSTKNFQVGGRDSVQLQAAAGLLVEGGTGQFNNGVTVGGATSNFNATVNINNTSSFGGPASFNNHAASFNQGITVGGAASNFNSNLNANSNVTLGAADGTTPITINASNIDMSTNNSVITLRDGQNGLTDNGALMFFTGSGGDFMKFHTSGSAKGVVFPQEVYLSNIPANRVLVSDTNGKVTSHSPFTFTSDVLAVPTVTASVGIDVTSSANGSINIGEGIRYIFGGDDRLDVFENEFRIRKTNLYQAVFPEQTSNFDIGDSQVFLVDTNGSVVTGTLPGVTSTDDYGITYTIKDSGGNAETNNVVIEPSGSQKIDGGSAAKIETNYGAITVMGISSSVNGFGWAIVSAT